MRSAAAGERRGSPRYSHRPLERDARVALRREIQPGRELPGARRRDVECDFGARGGGRLGERARQARTHAPARAVEPERRAPFAQDPLDRAGAERSVERLAAQASAEPRGDRLAARLAQLGRIETHRHRPSAGEVAVREPRVLDPDARFEVAGEGRDVFAGGVQPHPEAAHGARHMRCVEQQLGNPAERRIAREKLRAHARRRRRAVDREVAFESRAGDRRRQRRGEPAGVDANVRSDIARIAWWAREVPDRNLHVGVDRCELPGIEADVLELAEGAGKRRGFLGGT